MTKPIQEKTVEVQDQLKILEIEYQELLKNKALKERRFMELQGALKVLTELNGDQSTESGPS